MSEPSPGIPPVKLRIAYQMAAGRLGGSATAGKRERRLPGAGLNLVVFEKLTGEKGDVLNKAYLLGVNAQQFEILSI